MFVYATYLHQGLLLALRPCLRTDYQDSAGVTTGGPRRGPSIGDSGDDRRFRAARPFGDAGDPVGDAGERG